MRLELRSESRSPTFWLDEAFAYRVLSDTQQADAVQVLCRLGVGYGFVVGQLEGILGDSAATVTPPDEGAAWSTLLDLVGAELLSGGKAVARMRRRSLLALLSTAKLASLARLTRDAFEWGGGEGDDAQIARIAARRWVAG